MRILQSHPQLKSLGITQPNRIYWQLNTPQLYEEAVQRHEGYVAHLGPLVVRTGNQTSLTHNDRFIVSEPAVQGNISWGEVNRPFNSERFDQLLKRMTAYFQGLDVFVQDAYARVGKDQRMPIRVLTETAWHNLFVRNNYLPVTMDELESFAPQYTVIHAPGFRAIPERDGTNSDVFVIVHLTRNLILIGGTSFAGEIQKAIFSVINYLLPRRNVLTMECAASIGDRNDTALFVGVDGAGKTTLATENSRTLIGDSEHGWDSNGIFSITRGCYARLMGLTMENSPDIWQTTRRFGTLLENVVINAQTRHLDLMDGTFTENTRAAYPISHILRATRDGMGTHPQNIFMLVKDVFGVLPPIAKLTPEQAHFYFLSGYSPQLVTNQYGETSVKAKFTACYGAPFMPLHPGQYARMFAEKIKQHQVDVWLVNTGWMGGTYDNGSRIPLEVTRNILQAVLTKKLARGEFKTDAYFGLHIPITCPGVPTDMLDPMTRWRNAEAYAETATLLVHLFEENIAQYHNEVDPASLAAQPDFG